jgi:hypothetical protein
MRAIGMKKEADKGRMVGRKKETGKEENKEGRKMQAKGRKLRRKKEAAKKRSWGGER